MRRSLSLFLLCVCCGFNLCAQTAAKPQPPAAKPQPPAAPRPAAPAPLPAGLYAVIDTSMGRITCRLLPNEAPRSVENFRGLATGSKSWTDPKTGSVKHAPLYDGLTFHRIIRGFMIQTGDPLGTGEGGPGFSVDDEISPNLHFDKPGVLAMAKRSFPNSAGSQFFITTAAAPWLENNYSIFGEVVAGQEIVQRISEVPTGENDKPLTPVTIRHIAIRNIGISSHAARVSHPAPVK
jgi:peptidyl-prolyl cis-trans isomerase A (cyclophilin A)